MGRVEQAGARNPIRVHMVRWAAAATLALSLGGCIGYDGEVTRGYVLDPRALEQVKVGSAAE